MSLKHLFTSENKEVTKDDWGPVKKDLEDNLKDAFIGQRRPTGALNRVTMG